MGFLTPNELGDSFLAPNDRAYFHQNNLIQNCDRMSDDRQRETDTSDLIICCMLCYSNGIDKNITVCTHAVSYICTVEWLSKCT